MEPHDDEPTMPKFHDEADHQPPPLVSVVVPAYNEALVLMASLTAIYAELQAITDRYRFELIVVDDGSTDETGDIAEAFARSRPEVRVLRHKVNFRLGQALRYGFGQSWGDYVVAFDADLTYSTDHIPRLVDALRDQHAKVVIASPYMKGGRTTGIPWSREAMSKGVNRLLSLSTQDHMRTVTGMVRGYDGPFLRSLNLKAMGPEINTEILYKAQILRARVVEIPAHLDWSEQEERMRTRKVSLRVSTTSKLQLFATFLFRPIAFFIVPGLILLVISGWTLMSVLISVIGNYREAHAGLGFDPRLTGAFAETFDERPHSFVIGGMSLLLSVQLISLGLLATQAKRYFEELFHLGTTVLRRLQRDEVRDTRSADLLSGAAGLDPDDLVTIPAQPVKATLLVPDEDFQGTTPSLPGPRR